MKSPPWLLAAGGEIKPDRRLALDPTETRHAAGALRLRSGDAVMLTNGQGAVASGVITLRRRSSAEVMVRTVDHIPHPAPGLTLAVGVLAGAAMDLVVQKAVELGVERLIPVCCERSQMGLKRATTREEHWRRISRQALKQCHRAWTLELAPATILADFIGDPAAIKGLIAHPLGLSAEEFRRHRVEMLLIGPEGGFSGEEEHMLDEVGWPKVCLGPHVLRAETAAIAGAAVFCTHGSGLHSTDG